MSDSFSFVWFLVFTVLEFLVVFYFIIWQLNVCPADDIPVHKKKKVFRSYQNTSLSVRLLFCYEERNYYAVLRHQKESRILLIGAYI